MRKHAVCLIRGKVRMLSLSRDRENRGRGAGPSDGRVRAGRDRPPSNHSSSDHLHIAVQPNVRGGKPGGTSTRNAIYSGVPLGTNIHQPRRSPVRAFADEP